MTQNAPSSRHVRRWYDKIGRMTLALHVSRQFPREIQALIADNLNAAIDDHRQRRRTERQAYSMGWDLTVGLYKASKSRRWYDPENRLHRAYMMMGTLPESFLVDFADRVVGIHDFMREHPTVGQSVRDRRRLVDAAHCILLKRPVPDALKMPAPSQGGIRVMLDGVPVNSRRRS